MLSQAGVVINNNEGRQRLGQRQRQHVLEGDGSGSSLQRLERSGDVRFAREAGEGLRGMFRHAADEDVPRDEHGLSAEDRALLRWGARLDSRNLAVKRCKLTSA